jgi:hypothetical protein
MKGFLLGIAMWGFVAQASLYGECSWDQGFRDGFVKNESRLYVTIWGNNRDCTAIVTARLAPGNHSSNTIVRDTDIALCPRDECLGKYEDSLWWDPPVWVGAGAEYDVGGLSTVTVKDIACFYGNYYCTEFSGSKGWNR